jgi:septation ring formation regulator EzrA
MAELGALANVVTVVGVGLQLSVALFDFASTLGSAGHEIEDMGSDITLLCAVLKRVQSTLDSPRSVRLSVTAIQTTQDILNRCRKTLDDINSILKKLRKDGQRHVDVLARVKWTLKRPKILMLRSSLQSCTTTLHLMLSAIDWAHNAARRQVSSVHIGKLDRHALTFS